MIPTVRKLKTLYHLRHFKSLLRDLAELLLDPTSLTQLNDNFTETAKQILQLGHWNNETELDTILGRIKRFYFPGNEAISKDSLTRFNLTNMMGDRAHYHPTKTASIHHSMQSHVYRYYLTKEANVSYAGIVEQYVDPPYGVSHADDVQYFFPHPGYPYIPMDSQWFNFSKMFVKFLVSFATNG